MGKYHDFMEAYQKACAHVRKQLMNENGNKLWKFLIILYHTKKKNSFCLIYKKCI